MSKANQTIDANTLVNAIIESQRASLTTLFASLGIAQVTAHPSSVPTPATPRATSTQTMRPVAPTRIQATQATQAQAHTQTAPPQGIGELEHCKVGENRTKLPKGLFDGYSYVVLNMPDGSQHTVNTSSEGRGRLTVNQTDAIGAYASEGHYLVFTPDVQYGNMYDVAIMRGEGALAPTQGTTRTVTRPVAPARTAQGNGSGKRERSPAQKANDARLGKLAQERRAQTGSVTGNAQGHGVARPAMPARPVKMERVTNDLERIFSDGEAPTVAAPRVPLTPRYMPPTRRTR